MEYHLQSARRRSLLIPLVHPTTSKKSDPFYIQFYEQLASYVHVHKPHYNIELLFVFPRDEHPYEVINKKYQKDQGIHSRLSLVQLPNELRTANTFLSFLPRLVCVQIDRQSLNVFEANSSFSQCFRQLQEETKFNFKPHMNVRDLFEQVQESTEKVVYKTDGVRVESTFYVVLFETVEEMLGKVQGAASKALKKEQ
ncbi:Conserved_hypothetical protein [Hexamita inflata]|uniref:Uncharacterized protein n=1 Tax=Hexamita inflata TaxID=28002 RepID=A0AA86NC03_9EUKA|nr:Conserved hypothetical protein [Hexamita inflata]CAI9945536.1 Conserved hypothetical protein [Hexamita inflata]CAI9965050.1 Conserved hypothetical protein [Hexamita inflata]